MNGLLRSRWAMVLLAVVLFQNWSRSATLEDIGVTALRAVTTNLNGAGIRVAQPEGQVSTNPPSWQVNPGYFSHLAGRFAFTSALGSTNVFPNSVGAESWHANTVGRYLYGISEGVATNLALVDSYDAEYFIQAYYDIFTNLVAVLPAADINDPVVNQSFIFLGATPGEQQILDVTYDDYAARFKTLFVSGAGNGGVVCPPSTCYNGLSVGCYGPGVISSVGPTIDNGRCKPDITAPHTHTSFSTPMVSGVAALLMQAALRGDGGSDTNAAFDIRTLKALLLNGALKPADWTNGPSTPLDARYGAGVLNALNAYKLLAGGKHDFVVSNQVAAGVAHPPIGAVGTVPALMGWDFNSVAGGADPAMDAVNHYYFNVSNAVPVQFSLVATLVWNRQLGETNINNLNLFLYNCADGGLVACSTSLVDNVEHIRLPHLVPGRYDLQVWKSGGGAVSAAETYALAWEFLPPPPLAIVRGSNAALQWPLYPAGFHVEKTMNLISAVWNTNNLANPYITNGQYRLPLDTTNSSGFFRLRRP